MAVVGVGRAGQARVRAIAERDDLVLAAAIPRAPASGSPSLEDVLADPDVDGVIVCTPNALHETQVAAALAAGKHVAVEFPLAASAETARALFARAARAGRVLHVEHIELLSPAQTWLRERAAALGAPDGGGLKFSAGAEGWIGDPDLAGSPALRATARLHRLVDLYGEAEVAAARLSDLGPGSGYSLEAELRFRGGGRLTLVEERGPNRERSTRWHVQCAGGVLQTPPAEPAGALFAADLDCFVRRVRGVGEAYVADARVLHVLELVGAIETACADAQMS